jgi:hypothetical protein
MTPHEQLRYEWRKSPDSNPSGNCVEKAELPDGTIGIRDSKDYGLGPVLIFTGAEWEAFTAPYKRGEEF